MKKILIILFTLIYSFNSFAQDGVFFLDIDILINKSNSGKKIVKKLQEINNQNKLNIKKYEDDLKKQDDEINKVKNILSEDELNSKVKILKNRIVKYREKKDKIYMEYNELKNKELESYFKQITPFIEEFMEINSIKVILDKKNIFIANANYDITNSLIEFLNLKLADD